MRRVIGVDFGRKRVGIAISDPLGLTARPLEVAARDRAVARIAELAGEYEAATIVVGIPRSLSGGDSDSERLARELGEELGAATDLPVEYVDERFTSKMAEAALLESGMRREERRQNVDKVAAALILQSYLGGNSKIGDDVEDTGAQ